MGDISPTAKAPYVSREAAELVKISSYLPEFKWLVSGDAFRRRVKKAK
jgi:hypothetical protein